MMKNASRYRRSCNVFIRFAVLSKRDSPTSLTSGILFLRSASVNTIVCHSNHNLVDSRLQSRGFYAPQCVGLRSLSSSCSFSSCADRIERDLRAGKVFPHWRTPARSPVCSSLHFNAYNYKLRYIHMHRTKFLQPTRLFKWYIYFRAKRANRSFPVSFLS